MVTRNRKGGNPLNEALERRMLLYALAAAGATLAGASAAPAKVISTHRPESIRYDFHPYYIDLNNDGVADIVLSKTFRACSLCSDDLYTISAGGVTKPNAVEGALNLGPAALTIGAKIGSSASFITSGWLANSGYTGSGGNFLNTSHNFLGVRFQINGQTHYGWIGFQRVVGATQARISGWAYETIPNKTIAAGDRGLGDSAAVESAPTAMERAARPAFEPTSLQLLAMGHAGIADRQRRMATQANS